MKKLNYNKQVSDFEIVLEVDDSEIYLSIAIESDD